MDKYYIGLDVGTNSVGWAVTDENYNLKRLKGKHAWGARIFKEAKGKKERRMIRSSRRRIQRRNYRIQLLNEIFCEEINRIDNTFFIRMENSSYHLIDKEYRGIGKNLIFKNKEQESNFYSKYPTIWHLRKDIIDNKEEAYQDIRYVYLAIHHIIKYRGNFLLENELDYNKLDDSKLIKLNDYLKDKYYSSNSDDSLEVDFININSLNKLNCILLDDNLNKTTKQKEIKKLFNTNIDSLLNNLINMFATIVTGGTFKLNKLNPANEKEIDFNKASYEDDLPSIQSELGDDFVVVSIAKEFFDYVTLNIDDEMKNNIIEMKKSIDMFLIETDKSTDAFMRCIETFYKFGMTTIDEYYKLKKQGEDVLNLIEKINLIKWIV